MTTTETHVLAEQDRTELINSLTQASQEMLTLLSETQVVLGRLACQPTTQETLDFVGEVSDVIDGCLDEVIGGIGAVNTVIDTINTNIPVPVPVPEPEELPIDHPPAESNDESAPLFDYEPETEPEIPYEEYVLDALANIAFRHGYKAGQEVEVRVGNLVMTMYERRLDPQEFDDFMAWLRDWDEVIAMGDEGYIIRAPERVNDLELAFAQENQALALEVEDLIRGEAEFRGIAVGGKIDVKVGWLVNRISGEDELSKDDFHNLMQRLRRLKIVEGLANNIVTVTVPAERRTVEIIDPSILDNFLENLPPNEHIPGGPTRLHINQIAKAIFGRATKDAIGQINQLLLNHPRVTKISKAMFDIEPAKPDALPSQPKAIRPPAQHTGKDQGTIEAANDGEIFDDQFIDSLIAFAREGGQIKLFEARNNCEAIHALSDQDYKRFKTQFGSIRQRMMERLQQQEGVEARWNQGGQRKGSWYQFVIE